IRARSFRDRARDRARSFRDRVNYFRVRARNGDHAETSLTSLPDVATIAIAPSTPRPGDVDVVLLGFTVQNNTLSTVTLDSLTLTNESAGPGSQPDLDGTLTAVAVYHDNGDGVVGFGDTILGSGIFSGGSLTAAIDLTLDPGVPHQLLVACDVDSFCTADNDTLAVQLSAAADLHFDTPARITGAFPLANGAGSVIDGMLAHQINVVTSADSLIITTLPDNLVFDFGIPGNGYQPDTLITLTLQNLGTATSVHIARLALYADGGDATFDAGTADDVFLGNFVDLGRGEYKLSSLATALTGGCGSFTQFFAAADIDPNPGSGASIQFSIPVMGMEVASENDGPLDGAVVNPSIQLIPQPDELTAFPYSVGDKRVFPGKRNVLNFGIGFYNGFNSAITLEAVELFQQGLAGVTEVLRIRAYADVDTNGLFDPTDDLLDISTSTNGTYILDGFTLPLAAKSISYLFVTYDLALSVRDSVDIDFQLNSNNDLTFAKPVDVKGQFPINSPGVDFTDGMIAAQVGRQAAPPARVPPGDFNVFALAFTLPSNGAFSDQLGFITIGNAGTALPGQDITLLNLWQEDSGDNSFDPAQDRLLTTLIWTGSAWRNPLLLGETIGETGLACYVSADIAATAADDRTIQLFVPVNGVEVASGNDGPLDLALANPFVQTISTDPLITSIVADAATYTVGQTVTVTMTARNVGPTPLVGVHPSVPTISGAGIVTPVGGPIPASLTIPSGGDTTFVWTYAATAPGDVTFCGRAFDTDSSEVSVATCAEPVLLQSGPSNVTLSLGDLSPPAVNQGQDNVEAVRVVLNYASADTLAAPVDLVGLDVSVLDSGGLPVAPNSVLAGMTFISSTGTNYLFALVDSTANPLHLSLLVPISVAPGDSVELDVELDISASAVPQQFRLSIASVGDVHTHDANTGLPVTPSTGETFPWQTGLIDVDLPADSLLVASTDTSTITVNVSQDDIHLFGGELRNPGPVSAADEILTQLSLEFFDDTGTAIPPADVIRKLTIQSGPSNLYLTESIPSTGNRL
ncbi:MAG: hypothetical protein IH969_07235, partial [Candidatus Krumholzibacteriota bacterium]|nr:hypothetical protein [Candidatus Krumholzibacteriota bacterium]